MLENAIFWKKLRLCFEMRGHTALYLKNQTYVVWWPTPYRRKPLTTLSSVHSYCLFVNSFIPVTLNDWWVDQSSPDWGAAWQAVKVTIQAYWPGYMSAFFYLAMGYEKERGGGGAYVCSIPKSARSWAVLLSHIKLCAWLMCSAGK